MSEQGGPTTQSGIFYQNSVTALYLGRLLDATECPASERIIQVRVEAPVSVDDIVITFGDEHKEYIQAKENITISSDAWKKLWSDFNEQFHSQEFQKNSDRLLLQIGKWRNEHSDLQELCQRASTYKSYEKWEDSLSKDQKKLLEKIKLQLPPQLLSKEDLLKFFDHIDVDIWPLKIIEQSTPSYIPQTNIIPHTLFRLLRDRAGENARIRGSFTAHQLRESLQNEMPDLTFSDPPDVKNLRTEVKYCSAFLRQHKHTIANTDEYIKREIIDNIIDWLLQDEDNTDKNVAMLLDQAGMGKSVVMRDVLCNLETKSIDVLAIKADRQLSDVINFTEVPSKLGLTHSVEQTVERLAKLGRVVVLIDQIDALSFSLAHNQKALNIVSDLIARLRGIPNVRILISCRVFDYNTDPQLKSIPIGPQFALPELSDTEIQSVIQKLGLDYHILSLSTRQLLRIPQQLHSFALVVEKNKDVTQLQEVTTLQELYDLLWQRQEPGSPSLRDRSKVLDLLLDHMNSTPPRVSAPQSLTDENEDLKKASDWLASAGILIPDGIDWTFLHQTFFDYWFARRFVEQNGDIVETILHSNQGLFERSILIQVMTYLRSQQHDRYLRDLDQLLNQPHLRFHVYEHLAHWFGNFRKSERLIKSRRLRHRLYNRLLRWSSYARQGERLIKPRQLRFHLYYHLLQWFGNLTNPTDEEWLLAQQLLLNPEKQAHLLLCMQGNSGWLKWLYPFLKEWLEKEDVFIDRQVIPYLATMVSIGTAQADIAKLIHPYLGRSKQWEDRIRIIFSRIRNWYATEAIELFEQSIYQSTDLDRLDILRLEMVAKADPKTGCRLVRFVFDQILEDYLKNQEKEKEELGEEYAYKSSLLGIFDKQDILRSTADGMLQTISQAEPKLYIETMLPWLEKILLLQPIPPDKAQDYYMGDQFAYGWYAHSQHSPQIFIYSLISALTALAKTEPQIFRPIATHLAALPYQTPQLLLAHVYRAAPEIYAQDALDFLLSDERRLDLGDNRESETRQVIKAIYPSLNIDQRAKLEQYILGYAPIFKWLGVDALRRRGIEQFRMLQSIPAKYLTPTGIQQLRQLERKFPGYKVSEEPRTAVFGTVTSPIPKEAAHKMSDKHWLQAMKKYSRGVEHRDILKGGAYQFSSGVLAERGKEDPVWLYNLLQQAPDDIDDSYATTFINVLAESDVPAEWFFSAVRRFALQEGRDIKRPVAWAIEKKLKNGEFPSDITQMLFDWTYTSVGEDEWWWKKGENHGDIYHSYLNSDRGAAFLTLMRLLDNEKSDDAKVNKWSLIEFAASDPSTAIRIGAIQELIYMIRDDRERALVLFEQLMHGHEILIEDRHVREFLYWAFYKNFLRVEPYITTMMNHSSEQVQEQGAQLACIAAISSGAMESPEASTVAKQLAEKALNGPPSWRRGAAHIYAHNIARTPMEVCKQKLITLIDDEDEQVREYINRTFYGLNGEHLISLHDFIEIYAGSKWHGFDHQFTEFLWKHGLLDPVWTLSIVETILYKTPPQGQWWWGIEELIRLVLRIYTTPTSSETLKGRAMDVFDILTQRHSIQTKKILAEFDPSV